MKIKLSITIAMIFLIFSILLTSFWIAIYGDPTYKFYKDEYENYQVTEALHMNIQDVMTVTEYMMDYLIGKEDVLSIGTTVDGKYQDFFNEQDQLHMADVRNLFLGGLKLRNICFALAVILLLAVGILKKNKKDFCLFGEYFHGYLRGLLLVLILAVVLGIGCAINFSACFTLFHKIFFTNNLWIFDPNSDYMINMLPEGLFFDFVVRITKIFGGILVGVGILWKLMELFFAKHKDCGS